jgi:hypothetical protein
MSYTSLRYYNNTYRNNQYYVINLFDKEIKASSVNIENQMTQEHNLHYFVSGILTFKIQTDIGGLHYLQEDFADNYGKIFDCKVSQNRHVIDFRGCTVMQHNVSFEGEDCYILNVSISFTRFERNYQELNEETKDVFESIFTKLGTF